MDAVTRIRELLTMRFNQSSLLMVLLMLSACSSPAIRSGGNATPSPETEPATTQPSSTVAPQLIAPPAEPLTTPPVRSYTLNAASTALVAQAHAQLSSKNSMMAASTIERALRIEPNNPLLWIEYAQVRFSEQNYTQAESMGRKALMLASGDTRTQSNAWRMIANSLRAQNKSNEAQLADSKADGLMPR
jgi:predicted Zn-dependent protease